MSHLNNFEIFLLLTIVKIAIVLVITLMAVAYTVLLERKVLGRLQNRWGPSRVGPFGLAQPLVDGLKLFLKEDMMPLAVERPLFILAPIIALGCALISIAVVPFGAVTMVQRRRPIPDRQPQHRPARHPRRHQHRRLRHRALRLELQQQVLPLRLAPLHRADDQLRARPRPLAVGVVLRAQSLSLRDIVASQSAHGAPLVERLGGFQFIALFIYLMAAYAETNRSPFDLSEAESELVAGYHTEYSS